MQGGHSSSGAGNRSGRRTATKAGISTTANERIRRQVNKYGNVSLNDFPPKDVLLRHIAAGRCCFCEDEQVFHSLSGHWANGHHIDLQIIRDYLLVPKKYSFISEELRKKYYERGKRYYDPEKLKGNKGIKGKPLSALALLRQVSNGRKLRQKYTAEEYVEFVAKRSEAAHKALTTKAVQRRDREKPTCVICGKDLVWLMGRNRPKTCSSECDRERRSILAKSNPMFSGDQRKRKLCMVDGCNRIAVARSMCDLHYRRQRQLESKLQPKE